MPAPRLFLVDTYGFIFRAYHARARSSAPPMRTSSGLSTEAVYIFHNLVRKLVAEHRPEYIAAVMECEGPTFREEHFTEYKANRSAMPDDLKQQIPYITRLIEAMRIPMLRCTGYEADDVIGTLACQAPEHGLNVVIVSSDKDMLQLVNDKVSMLNPAKDDVWYDAAKTEEFMGVKPEFVADLLALKGDAIDNIPGAPGIGDKGARDLILKYGHVENLLERAAEVEKKTYRESLLANRDQILLSKKLATIETNVPVDWSPESVKRQEPDAVALKGLYKELEFYSLMKEVGPLSEATGKDYAAFATAEELETYLNKIPADASVAICLLVPEKEGVSMATVGLAWEPGCGRSIRLPLLSNLKPLLEDPRRTKLTHDLKSLLLVLEKEGIQAQGFEHDVMLYGFLLTSDPSSTPLQSMVERNLDRKISAGAAECADCILELCAKLLPEVQAKGMENVYRDIDFPTAPVLARMELFGIRVEPEQLKRLSGEMDAEIQRLAGEIYQAAGKTFNINSPQQLGKVLYEDMGLQAPVKYGKGKTLSTAADILESLAEDHPIARLVLDYRQLTKLKGTYVDALPLLLDEEYRVHTTYNMTGASTGRLSSSNPNLQNIPIRTQLGREIRAAFVPKPGWKIIAADYSQIELRLLAHFSEDPVLLDAFRTGQDIHTRTAAEVFNAAPELVTSEMRRFAKTVNFGIVYGQTSFGLAKQLQIDRKEAEKYIERYFQTYSGVRRYIDATIAEARQTGMCRTLFGRQRMIPDMLSRNPSARTFAERTAVNSPLQGTAADLIKMAMTSIHHELTKGYQTRMLLQVHDELLFEAPQEEIDRVKQLVCERMQNVYPLRVPLLVDVGIGDNWRDAK